MEMTLGKMAEEEASMERGSSLCGSASPRSQTNMVARSTNECIFRVGLWICSIRCFLTRVAMRTWGLVVAVTLGLSGCSILRSTNSAPHYFWDSNLQTKQIHAPVACTSLHALLTFNRLYASGTAKDKLEEATLLGESSFYASDAPPDSPCQRAGHPVGPVNTPGSTDRVKNITASSDGTVSFDWDFASAVAESPRQTQTYYTYPEYLVSGGPRPDR
jgi:hypothetical protein